MLPKENPPPVGAGAGVGLPKEKPLPAGAAAAAGVPPNEKAPDGTGAVAGVDPKLKPCDMLLVLVLFGNDDTTLDAPVIAPRRSAGMAKSDTVGFLWHLKGRI